MTDSSPKTLGKNESIFLLPTFRILFAALLSFIVVISMSCAGKKGSESTFEVSSEAAAKTPDSTVPAEPVLVETRITYEYAESGDTYTLMDEGGPGPWEFTCSGIATIKTSSVLAPQGRSSYMADNLTDMTESTAWAEGKSGFGIGESIEFTLTDEYKKWGYTNEDFIQNQIYGDFVIQTGYAKSPAVWKRNGRPAKLKCYLNGQVLSIVQLLDTPSVQAFDIFPSEGERPKLKEGDVIRFEILDVVKGTKDEDACISEFHIVGSCG